jgi:adenylate kinase family enzyme
MIVSIIGMPGSGKSTLAKNIATRFGFEHISAGDVARKLAETDEEVKEALDAGQLAPREKMNTEMARIICDSVEQDKRIVLDGFPRYANQLQPLLCEPFGDTIYLILACDEETARERLIKRARSDDKRVQIDQRITTYYEETEPMIGDILDNDRTAFVVMGTPMDQFNDASHFLTMACDIYPHVVQ